MLQNIVVEYLAFVKKCLSCLTEASANLEYIGREKSGNSDYHLENLLSRCRNLRSGYSYNSGFASTNEVALLGKD